MKVLAGIAAMTSLGIVVPAVQAQRVILDDALSPKDTWGIQLAWEPQVIGRAITALFAGTGEADVPMTGTAAGVEVRLDTRRFEGEAARIYLTLPSDVAGLERPGDVELSWDASGPFLAGSARPGNSSLVFEGRIGEPVTTAVFNFTLLLHGLPEVDTFELEPFYELEVLP